MKKNRKILITLISFAGLIMVLYYLQKHVFPSIQYQQPSKITTLPIKLTPAHHLIKSTMNPISQKQPNKPMNLNAHHTALQPSITKHITHVIHQPSAPSKSAIQDSHTNTVQQTALQPSIIKHIMHQSSIPPRLSIQDSPSNTLSYATYMLILRLRTVIDNIPEYNQQFSLGNVLIIEQKITRADNNIKILFDRIAHDITLQDYHRSVVEDINQLYIAITDSRYINHATQENIINMLNDLKAILTCVNC